MVTYMQLCNALLAWLSPSTCHMEQFVHSTASSTVQMWTDTNMSTHSGSQGGKCQLPSRASGQFVCCSGRLSSPYHGTWRVQKPAGGRARRDSTQCHSAVPAGSSSCPSLLPVCDSLNLVLIDLPQWTSRCPAQGRVGEYVRKRDVSRKQAAEVPFTSPDLLPTLTLFCGQLQMLLSLLLIPCCFNPGKFESDLNGHLHEEKVFC